MGPEPGIGRHHFLAESLVQRREPFRIVEVGERITRHAEIS
jgi:hypothetical protein